VAKAKIVNIDSFNESDVMALIGAGGVPPDATTSAQKVVAQPVPAETGEQPVAGELPVSGQPVPTEKFIPTGKSESLPPAAEGVLVAVQPALTAESEKPAPAKRKRQKMYDESFLPVLNIGSLRKPVAISPDTHKKLDSIVRVALDGCITLSNFVENILLHHIEEYREELENKFSNNLRQKFI
jgi:hypothetical protein